MPRVTGHALMPSARRGAPPRRTRNAAFSHPQQKMIFAYKSKENIQSHFLF
jgi:hypothetical protein